MNMWIDLADICKIRNCFPSMSSYDNAHDINKSVHNYVWVASKLFLMIYVRLARNFLKKSQNEKKILKNYTIDGLRYLSLKLLT